MLTLYNIHTGLFETYLINIELSTSYCGRVEHWVLVLCQGIKYVLGDCVEKMDFGDVVRVITGAPVVRIAAVNLRAVKRVVYEGWANAGSHEHKNGYVVGTKDVDNEKFE